VNQSVYCKNKINFEQFNHSCISKNMLVLVDCLISHLSNLFINQTFNIHLFIFSLQYLFHRQPDKHRSKIHTEPFSKP
jgi:hypothetical protein